MRRRTIAWIVGSLVLTGVVLSFALVRAGKKHLYVENFSSIQRGMTQADVETLLGGPPGNYGRYSRGWMTLEGCIAPPGSVEKDWHDDSHRFEIYFDQEGRVVGLHKRARYQQVPNPSWLDRLRSWLGL